MDNETLSWNLTSSTAANTTARSSSWNCFPAFHIPIGLCGVVSNGLVIVGLVISRKRPTPYNHLVISLTTADCLFSVLCASFAAYCLLFPSYISPQFCSWSDILRFAVKLYQFYMMGAIAYARCTICRSALPTDGVLTRTRVTAILSVSAVLTVGMAYLYRAVSSRQYHVEMGTCTFTFLAGNLFSRIQLVNLLAVVTVSMIWYGMMYHYVKGRSISGSNNRQREKVISRTMIIVLISYFLGIGVSLVGNLVHKRLKSPEDSDSSFVAELSLTLHMLFSTIDPFFYGFKSDQVKATLRKCCPRHQTVTPAVNILHVQPVRNTGSELQDNSPPTVG